jgi:chromatin remodeling complex protein RSC6
MSQGRASSGVTLYGVFADSDGRADTGGCHTLLALFYWAESDVASCAVKRSPPGGSQAIRRDTMASAQSGLFKEVQPSEELATIVGSTPLPRTEITKRLWAYIKEHGLQDARNRRMINPDAKLRPVVGGQEQVSMFDLPKLVSRHVR